MIRPVIALALSVFTFSAFSSEDPMNKLAEVYFDAWQSTQQPQASSKDIENYLALLTDDVGHQHLPYDSDGSRSPDGKASMREGMGYYLGAHVSYESTLKKILIGYKVIVLTYSTKSAGVHPQSGETVHLEFDTMEVLEIEDGKVAVIRKYEE